ncbi:ead/Ea22-like family protein [Salmonella enterica subsp. enterica serovar Stanleyville]|nr:ead/Ea22-like family protein [Salmonella enterica subsp. enterica serovar Stanleyville]
MKEVKIYTIVSDQLSPPITGESFCTDMVRHSDYAELEAKCAALAAENTALKKSEVEFNEYCRHECEDVGDTWVDDFTETPATDAFLDAVRAQGVDLFAKREITDAVAELIGGSVDISLRLRESADRADEFAAQLRKGVQS